jgi:lipoxygenase homology domain-containing protein 1
VVTVKTGSIKGAGTDANVFITLNGEKNKINRHHLKKSDKNSNIFERDNTDVFTFEETDVGRVSCSCLSSDDDHLCRLIVAENNQSRT